MIQDNDLTPEQILQILSTLERDTPASHHYEILLWKKTGGHAWDNVSVHEDIVGRPPRRFPLKKDVAALTVNTSRPAPYFLNEIKAINRSPWQSDKVLQYLHQKKLEHGWVWIESQA